MNERFYHQPEMYYSPDKLVRSYGVPAPTPASCITRSARSRCPRKTRSSPIRSIPSPRVSICATTNKNGSMPLPSCSRTIPSALRKFMEGDMTLFSVQPIQPARRLLGAVAVRSARRGFRGPAAIDRLSANRSLAANLCMHSIPTTNGTNFFSSGLRQKVDQLMDILYAGGVNNPMDSIEQISYLLFLRLLTEKDETARGARQEIQAHLFGQMGTVSRGAISSR